MKLGNVIRLFMILLVVSSGYSAHAQLKDLPPHYTYKETLPEMENDSFPHFNLPEITIMPEPKDLSPKAYRQYTALELKVKKVYPMAKVAAQKLAQYNRVYLAFKTERERKDYIKQIEKDLFSEFEPEIRSMKVSEGRILIKLIDRETGRSSFEIIKEFKGGFNAFLWQGIARIFGHNLKSIYDPTREDQLIEYIIWQIDLGLI